MLPENPIVVFDGVCNVCSAGVKFILRNDRSGQIRFTTMQSRLGQDLFVAHEIDPDDAETFLLLKDRKSYTRSDAALEIARHFGFWRWLRIFGVLPKSWRDWAYTLLARNRYRWFGKRQSCYLPTEEERARFIDDMHD